MSTTSVERGFVNAGAGQIHFRRVGTGPVVILLHPSPQSSSFSMPMAQRLATRFTAIAVDTPGYGLSDPLPGNPANPELTDYLPVLRAFLDAMGIARAAFYGNATGAEIAHLFAHAYPERVALCMIDTAGHRDDAELNKTLAGYFPDATPRRDGGHLLTHWDMVRSLSLFSPWQKTAAAQRLHIDLPPPAAIHAKLLDYLAAGVNYAAAYRPAFYTAKHQLIRRLKVPATLTRWEGKPDLTEVDDLIARGLPANFTILRAGKSLDERLAVAEQHLVDHYLRGADAAPPSPPQINPHHPSWQRQFVIVQGRQMLLRRCTQGSALPLLALHDALRSSSQFVGVLDGLLGRRPVIAPDLPGCGDSMPADGQPWSIEAAAIAVRDALDVLAVPQVDVVGWGSGGQIACELARLAPRRVRRLLQLEPLAFGIAADALRTALQDVSIAPRWDGAHLATAWSMVRDAELFFPWCERTARGVLARDVDLDPGRLDRAVQDLLKTGDRWQDLVQASLDHPVLQRWSALSTPCAVALRRGNAATEECVSLMIQARPATERISLPDATGDWTAALESFFDR